MGFDIVSVKLLLYVVCMGGWWCKDWCLMQLFMRNILFRWSVNMYVSNWVVYMVYMVVNMALNYDRRMFW